jgi:hypothetical protein
MTTSPIPVGKDNPALRPVAAEAEERPRRVVVALKAANDDKGAMEHTDAIEARSPVGGTAPPPVPIDLQSVHPATYEPSGPVRVINVEQQAVDPPECRDRTL